MPPPPQSAPLVSEPAGRALDPPGRPRPAGSAPTRAEALERLSTALARTLGREAVADVIVAHVVPALGAHAAAVIELTSDGDEVTLVGGVGSGGVGSGAEATSRHARLPVGVTLPVREVARTREAVFLESLGE